MAKNTSVMGIYPDRTTVSDALNVLHKMGYRPTDVSVMASDNKGSKDFAHQQRNKSLEGAAVGTALGAVLGAAVAWFASTQSATVTAVAPLAAAGPIFAALAGAGVGGVLGWLIGLLAGARVPEFVAKRYVGRIRRGGTLLSVHCDSPEWCDRAKKALKDTGGRNIFAIRETAADFGSADKPTERAPVMAIDRLDEAVPPATEPVVQDSKK